MTVLQVCCDLPFFVKSLFKTVAWAVILSCQQSHLKFILNVGFWKHVCMGSITLDFRFFKTGLSKINKYPFKIRRKRTQFILNNVQYNYQWFHCIFKYVNAMAQILPKRCVTTNQWCVPLRTCLLMYLLVFEILLLKWSHCYSK